jgi:ribose transport system substrate-binding protein
MITSEVKTLVVDAANIDELESAIDECDNNKIPVFNILNPINDEVKMLISPDYKEMGKMAGEEAKALLTADDKTTGHVLMLQGGYDSFLMQMFHDGFKTTLPVTKELTMDAPYCDFDETKAYTATKEALASANKTDLIFAQSESMAKGALKSIEEAKASVKLITVGADAEIIAAILNKKINCAVYFSPVELAQKAWLYVSKYLKDNAEKLPQYTGLTLGKADAQNAQALLKEGAKYASLPAQ